MGLPSCELAGLSGGYTGQVLHVVNEGLGALTLAYRSWLLEHKNITFLLGRSLSLSMRLSSTT